MATLTCAEARGLIFDYLDGELDTATARAVRQHRESCRNCPPLVQAIVAMLARLRSLPEPIPDEGFIARLVAVTLDPPGPSNTKGA